MQLHFIWYFKLRVKWVILPVFGIHHLYLFKVFIRGKASFFQDLFGKKHIFQLERFNNMGMQTDVKKRGYPVHLWPWLFIFVYIFIWGNSRLV